MLKRRKLVIALFIILCLALIGCGKKREESAAITPVIPETKYVYEKEQCNVEGIIGGTIGSAYQKNGILYAGVYNRDKTVEEGRYSVVKYNPEQNIQEVIRLQGKEDMKMWQVRAIENENYKGVFWTRDKDNDYKNDNYYLCTFDPQGKMTVEQDVTSIMKKYIEQGIILSDIFLDYEGKLYFAVEYINSLILEEKTIVYCINNDSKVEKLLELKDIIHVGFSQFGKDVILSYSDEFGTFFMYNLSTEENMGAINLTPVVNFVPGLWQGAEKESGCVVDNGKVYKIDLQQNICEYQFTFSDVQMEYYRNGSDLLVSTNDDEYYILEFINDDGEKKWDWTRVKKTDQLDDTEEIVIGVVEENPILRNYVTEFNKNAQDIRIVIKNYNLEESELQKDIMAGHMPDMVALGIIPLEKLVSRDLICDLSVFLESDSDVSREDFLPEALEIYTIDDKLYGIPGQIFLSGISAKKKTIAEIENWTISNFKEFLERSDIPQTALDWVTQNDMLWILFDNYKYDFIDFEHQTSNFCQKEFYDLLELVKMFPTERSENLMNVFPMMQEDEILLKTASLSSFDHLQTENAHWGDEAIFTGYPSREGATIVLEPLTTTYAIAKDSKYQKEMWELLKKMLTNMYEEATDIFSYYPSLEKASQNAMKKKMVENENGNEVEAPKLEYEIAGIHYEEYAATPDDIEKIKGYIKNAKIVRNDYPDLAAIIEEDAATYFSGEKNVEEVAKIIQNRVDTYLSEQN